MPNNIKEQIKYVIYVTSHTTEYSATIKNNVVEHKLINKKSKLTNPAIWSCLYYTRIKDCNVILQKEWLTLDSGIIGDFYHLFLFLCSLKCL